MRIRNQNNQLNLDLLPEERRGGRRIGAGRRAKNGRSGVSHRARAAFRRRLPAHVTMKLLPDVGRLRTKRKVQVIRGALTAARERFGTRVVHWSVQRDHIHIVCEPASQASLSQAMQGLAVRVAKGLNRLLGRRGSVFADRYHVRLAKTPRQVRNVLAYVLNNTRRHGVQRGERFSPSYVDAFSSGPWFDGWKNVPDSRLRRLRAGAEPPLVHPVTWLLTDGWRRHGLVSSFEVPGRCNPRVTGVTV